MLHLEDSVVVHAPVEEVFDFVADFRNTTRWHKNMKKVGFKTDEPPGLGSEYDWIETFMGKKMDIGGRIVAWDRPNGFQWQPTTGPYEMSGGWKFTADAGRTLVTRYSDTQLSGMMKFAAALMTPIARRQVRSELETLKAVIESRIS